MPSRPTSDRNRIVVDNIETVRVAANRLKVSASLRPELLSAGYEALVAASRRFDPSRATFSTFAFRPVLGSMLDVLDANSRWASRHTTISSDDSEQPHGSCPTNQDSERATLASQVLAALEKLPPFSRQLIKGHYLEERTLSSVGADHGLSRTRVSVHLSRAIQQLRQQLEDDFSTWPVETKSQKRRFTEEDKSEVLRRARQPATSLSQLARDFDIPRTTISTWLRANPAGTPLPS